MMEKALLRTIQSGTTEDMYSSVTHAAFWLAAGGLMSEANELLSALWQYQLPPVYST